MNLTTEQIRDYWLGHVLRPIGGQTWAYWRSRLLDEIIAMHDEAKDSPPAWSRADRKMISWLEATELPATFQVNAWTLVTDGPKKRRHLLACVAAGPANGVARAAMQHIRDVHESITSTKRAA